MQMCTHYFSGHIEEKGGKKGGGGGREVERGREGK